MQREESGDAMQRLVELCRVLLRRVEPTVPTLVAPRTVRDAILAASLGRAATTFNAIVDLAERGDGPQGAMLVRSLFEDAEVGYWVASFTGSDAVLARMWNDHDDLQNIRLAFGVKRAPEWLSYERVREVWHRFGDGRRAADHWTRRGSARRQREIRAAWGKDPKRKEELDLLAQTDQVIEVWSNTMLHHGPWGVLPFAEGVPGDVPNMMVTVGPTWHRGWAPLDLGYMSFGLLFYLLTERLSAVPADSLRTFLPDALEVRRLGLRLSEAERRHNAARDSGVGGPADLTPQS